MIDKAFLGKTVLICNSIEHPHLLPILDKLGEENVILMSEPEFKERGYSIEGLPPVPIKPLTLIETRRDFTPILDGRANRRERRRQKRKR